MSVRAAVIGSGFMGRTHLQAYSDLPGVDVVGVVSRSASSVAGVPAFGSVAELLERARPELVSVCTPTALHPAAVRELAAAGVDVVSEKPLAGDVATARALVEECQERGVHLFVAHVLRYFEQYVRAGAIARSGELGTVSTVRLRRAVPTPGQAWFRNPAASGGVILDLLIHDIDFLLGLFGAPTHVFARRRIVGENEHVVATMRFTGGQLAFLDGAWGGVNGLEFGCEIAGSAGTLAFDSAPATGLRLERAGGELSSVVEQPSSLDPYRAQLADFLARRSGPPVPDGAAVLAVAVCAALDRSAREGTTVTLEQEDA